AHRTAGVVTVDSGLDVRPFAELLRQLEPVLRGPGFDQVWPQFETSIGGQGPSTKRRARPRALWTLPGVPRNADRRELRSFLASRACRRTKHGRLGHACEGSWPLLPPSRHRNSLDPCSSAQSVAARTATTRSSARSALRLSASIGQRSSGR